MTRLAGKVALITGAGSGMGRVAAERFAREGAKVALVDLHEAPEVVEAITAAGGEAISVAADVSDLAAVQAAVEATVRGFGGLHILYNNAGVSLGDDDDGADTLHDRLHLLQVLIPREAALADRGHALPHEHGCVGHDPHDRRAGRDPARSGADRDFRRRRVARLHPRVAG